MSKVVYSLVIIFSLLALNINLCLADVDIVDVDAVEADAALVETAGAAVEAVDAAASGASGGGGGGSGPGRGSIILNETVDSDATVDTADSTDAPQGIPTSAVEKIDAVIAE